MKSGFPKNLRAAKVETRTATETDKTSRLATNAKYTPQEKEAILKIGHALISQVAASTIERYSGETKSGFLTAEEIAAAIPLPDSIGESFQSYRERSLKSPEPRWEKAVRLAWRAEPRWYHGTKKPLAFDAKTGDWTAPEFRGLS